MELIKKYFSPNGEMTGREWTRMKIVQSILMIVLFIIASFLSVEGATDPILVIVGSILTYMGMLMPGPIMLLPGASFVMSLVPFYIGILVALITIAYVWVDIVSAIKRARVIKENPIIAIVALHIGFIVGGIASVITTQFHSFYAGYISTLLAFILTLALQYKHFGEDSGVSHADPTLANSQGPVINSTNQ